MNTVNPIKLFITAFLCITSFTANNCMLSEFKHKPITHKPDAHTTYHRDRISKWIKFTEHGQINPIKDITTVRDSTDEEQQGKCFQYAITQTTGSSIPLTLYRKKNGSNGQKSTINIENYFKQTVEPNNNDLALYTKDQNSYVIEHFAIVVNKDKNILNQNLVN